MTMKMMAAAAAAVSALAFTPAVHSAPDDEAWRAARAAAAELAADMAQRCPVAGTGDQAAFDHCRQGLYGGSALRRQLTPVVLWGRQRDPKLPLKEASLTQFAPDVLTGMYLPLFMFSGEHAVDYVEREGLFQIRLRAAFRNRLQPGQFPYPFWHDAEKWTMYQGANEVLLWWDAGKRRVKVAQYTVFGAQPPLVAVSPVTPPRFDGHWMWTDDSGRSQPKVTVFDGLFRADNPYLAPLDASYKTLALRLREGQCDQCHVPNNPDKSKRLVLLQTPAHAAGEIQRLLKAVRDDRMPRDESGIENPLDSTTKQALLQDGEAFAKLVDAAKRWEAAQGAPRLAGGGEATRSP